MVSKGAGGKGAVHASGRGPQCLQPPRWEAYAVAAKLLKMRVSLSLGPPGVCSSRGEEGSERGEAGKGHVGGPKHSRPRGGRSRRGRH